MSSFGGYNVIRQDYSQNTIPDVYHQKNVLGRNLSSESLKFNLYFEQIESLHTNYQVQFYLSLLMINFSTVMHYLIHDPLTYIALMHLQKAI